MGTDPPDKPRWETSRLDLASLLPAAPPLEALLDKPRGPGEVGWLGPYRLRKLLGEGGMGLVFLADDTAAGRPVALKIIRPEAMVESDSRARFQREGRAAQAIRHEHVITLFQVGEVAAKGIAYLAMEVLEGLSLEAWLAKGQRATWKHVLKVGRQTAAGLAAAHAQGVIHRDIKPANLWLQAPKGHVKILDFGLARPLQENLKLTTSGMIIGTPNYMAPEQAQGDAVDGRSDLFSLGCVLYRMATGRLPFDGPNLLALLTALATKDPDPVEKLNPEMPRGVARLIHRLLARTPADRPASAQALVEEIQALERAGGQGPPETAAPTPPPLPPPAPTKKDDPTQRQEVPPSRRKAPKRRRRRANPWLFACGGAGVALLVLAWVLLNRVAEVSSNLATETKNPTPPAALQFVPAADQLQPGAIPPGLRALIGDNHPEKVPSVVAVLGKEQFRVPGMVEALAFHPKQPLLVAGTWLPLDGSVHFFHPRTAHQTRPPLQNLPGWVRAAAFDASGRYLAVACQGRFVGLYDAATWQPAPGWLPRDPNPAVPTSLAFNRDGNLLAIAYDNGTVALRAVPDGREVRSFPAGSEKWLNQVAFSADGRFLAVVSDGPGVQLYDPDGGALVRDLSPKVAPVHGLAFHPQQSLLATAHADHKVRLWDAATGAEVTTLPWPPEAEPWRVAFSPDGRLLAVVDTHERVKVWKVETWLPVAEVGGGGFTIGTDKAALAFSGDGQLLATAGPMRAVRLWDTATWKEPPTDGHHGRVNAVAASPDGRRLASAGEDGTLRLWDLAAARQERWLAVSPLPARAAAFSHDGQAVAFAGWDDTVRVYDAATGRERWQRARASGRFNALVFGPGWVGAGGADGRLHRWETGAGTDLPPLALHNEAVLGLALSADGQRLASVGADQMVRLWRTADGQAVEAARVPFGPTQVAFADGGRQVVVTGEGQAVPRWRVGPWAELPAWDGHPPVGNIAARVVGLAVHPDGRLVATSGSDGAIRLWRTDRTPALLTTFPMTPFGQGVRALAFTPEGRHLVTGNPDGTIVIIRLETPWRAK